MVVGLKKDDHHRTNKLLAFDPVEEIEIKNDSLLFLYLERMQDEVHNFTINYHKQIRSKGSLSSILDNVEGIGEKRKNELLKKYKTIKKLGEGSFGKIYKAEYNNDYYALKFENRKKGQSLLETEAKIMSYLKGRKL